MVDANLIPKNLRKPFHIVSRPSQVHLTILSEFCRHEVVIGADPVNLEVARVQCDGYVAGYMTLRACEEGLQVAHDGVEVLSFMKPVAVKLRQLIFPATLPFGEHVFLQSVMRFYDKDRRCRFKANPSLNPDDCIAYMYVASDAERPGDSLQLLDCFR